MDIRKVKKLIELLEESEYRRDRDPRRRGIGPDQPRQHRRAGDDRAHLRRRPALPLPAAAGTPAAAREPEGHIIRSPMVGTFYRAPSPGAKPFVTEGQASPTERPCASSRR